MSFQFTENQRRAVEYRGGTLLVSAAAGSGKTRVLTERLLRYVTDPNDPVDVDRFLIITFTRAAAAELRDRIMGALAACAAERPGDARIRRQQSLCCRAPIGTIHSFCSDLIREYSQALGVSPAFTILDEDRADEMKQDLASRLLDRRYERIDADGGFRLLADTIGAGRDDSRLQSTMLDLYGKLQSHPVPAKWAESQREAFALRDVSDAGETVWGREMLSAAQRTARFWADAMDEACAEIEGADEKLRKAYGGPFSEAAAILRGFCRAAAEGWDRARDAAQAAYPKLNALRGYDDAERKERLKSVWDGCKKTFQSLADGFSAPSAGLLDDLRAVSPAMDALLDLTMEFERLYASEKNRRGVLDYADLEHLAARLLADPETGAPTAVAEEIGRRYREIMVDEYQDVNAVQELIFRSVSHGGRNLFLVGDVKQSIYRFRLADPGLFLDKYRNFAPFERAAEGEPRRVLLQENFRSRRAVLDAANLVFGGIMSEALGELDYDEEAALRFGAQGYDPADDVPAELHVIDPADMDDDAPVSDELEARFVARKILSMYRAGTPVTENGVRRRCGWGDFVLLMRAPGGGKGQTFHRVLSEAGIPVDSQMGGGFFASLEVSVTVDLLSVIDNPHADIPLISVLRSPAFAFSGDELSAIRAANRDSDFYGAMCASAAAGDRKSAAFLEKLEQWRALAPETELGALVWRLCTETGLLAICAAMRDGEARRRNLMHLFEYARAFSQTGYRGVYRFVQWLRRKAERGEEPDAGADGQAVRILSIHKSKGLEFPFVFLCDLSHRFNLTDSRACVLVHSKLGLGPKRVDAEQGIEYPTLARRAVARRLTDETLSEEMRVLYVGMTRAKERLVLSCVMKNAGEALEELRQTARRPMPPELLRGMGSFAHWIASAAFSQPETLPITVHAGSEFPESAPEAAAPEAAGADPDAALAALREKLDFVYPWAGSVDLPSKLTATELKGPFEPDGEAASLTGEPAELRFRRPGPGKARKLTAAQRGTATHAFLQYVDLRRADSVGSLRAEAERLRAEGRLSGEEVAAIDLDAVERLFSSPLGREMRSASGLRREFRFQLLVGAADYFPSAAPEDEIMLQGVVDCCYFTPDGGVAVVDYKTDRVSSEEIPERSEHYRGQLEAYARALEAIFDRPVTKCVLWFLHAGAQYEISLQTR